MSCEKDIRLPVNTIFVRDARGNPIGIGTSNPAVINQLDGRLEGSNFSAKPKAIGTYLNLE